MVLREPGEDEPQEIPEQPDLWRIHVSLSPPPSDDEVDRQFDSARRRYLELASRPELPVSAEVELAARMAAERLGGTLDPERCSALFTTVVRAYLWRSVEDGPVGHMEPRLNDAVEQSFNAALDRRSPDDPTGVFFYYAAMQCIADEVPVWWGSIGGVARGQESYERAFRETTDNYEMRGRDVDEDKKREAFHFGTCLADSERILRTYE